MIKFLLKFLKLSKCKYLVFLIVSESIQILKMSEYIWKSPKLYKNVKLYLVFLNTPEMFKYIWKCSNTQKKHCLLFSFQYAFLLLVILVTESTILFFGYWFREEITAGFHAAMANGLQFYGKEPSLSSVVDDIQSTVNFSNASLLFPATALHYSIAWNEKRSKNEA